MQEESGGGRMRVRSPRMRSSGKPRQPGTPQLNWRASRTRRSRRSAQSSRSCGREQTQCGASARRRRARRTRARSWTCRTQICADLQVSLQAALSKDDAQALLVKKDTKAPEINVRVLAFVRTNMMVQAVALHPVRDVATGCWKLPPCVDS